MNSKKTQFRPISLKRNLSDFELLFQSSHPNPQESFNIIGVVIFGSNLSWKPYQSQKMVLKKLGDPGQIKKKI